MSRAGLVMHVVSWGALRRPACCLLRRMQRPLTHLVNIVQARRAAEAVQGHRAGAQAKAAGGARGASGRHRWGQRMQLHNWGAVGLPMGVHAQSLTWQHVVDVTGGGACVQQAWGPPSPRRPKT